MPFLFWGIVCKAVRCYIYGNSFSLIIISMGWCHLSSNYRRPLVILSQYYGFLDLYQLIWDAVFLNLRLTSNFSWVLLRCSRCSWLLNHLLANQLSMLFKFLLISKFYNGMFGALIYLLIFECILNLTAQCFGLQVFSLLSLDIYARCLDSSFVVTIITIAHLFFPWLSKLFSIRSIVDPFSFGIGWLRWNIFGRCDVFIWVLCSKRCLSVILGAMVPSL